MRFIILAAWAAVTCLIYALVGLAFLPHAAASTLSRAQKFLSKRARPGLSQADPDT